MRVDAVNSGLVDKLAESKPAAKSEDKSKLDKACHEMEGYFVGMLLKQMHQSAMKGGLFEEKNESATYREMFDDAVASNIGKRGAFGIADMLMRELSKRSDATEQTIEIKEPVSEKQ